MTTDRLTTTPDRPGRRGLNLYRFTEAPILEETGMMEDGPLSEEIQQIDLSSLLTGIGYEARVLFSDDNASDEGVSLVHAWFGAGYPLPTHTHNADCLYYVIRGSAILGKNVLGPGDGFFVPTDVPYKYEAGPEGVEILEFRTATKWDIQYPDQKAARWQANAEKADALRDEWTEAHANRRVL